MPITFTFDLSGPQTNNRRRIQACFTRLGWEHIGGSAWRYPALGTHNVSEDWFNHVVPALMYFRSLVNSKGLNVTKFTIDAHSEAGYRNHPTAPVGVNVAATADIVMYPSTIATLSEDRLGDFIQAAADNLD